MRLSGRYELPGSARYFLQHLAAYPATPEYTRNYLTFSQIGHIYKVPLRGGTTVGAEPAHRPPLQGSSYYFE